MIKAIAVRIQILLFNFILFFKFTFQQVLAKAELNPVL